MDESWDVSEGRGSPQGGKRYPRMQMMGSGFLAEMKAKQERRAYKVKDVNEVQGKKMGDDNNNHFHVTVL